MSYVSTDFTIFTEALPNEEYSKLYDFLILATDFLYEKSSNRNKIVCTVAGKVSVEEFTTGYRIPPTCKVMEGRYSVVIKYH